MVDSAPQWEAVLRRQKGKTQADPNYRRSRHRSRSYVTLHPLMRKLKLLNHVKEQEEYLQCGGWPSVLRNTAFHMVYSQISRFVFVVKLPLFSDFNFRAQIMQRGLCNKAAEKICPSPGKKSWMVLWLIER